MEIPKQEQPTGVTQEIASKQVGDNPRTRWMWTEASVWTNRTLTTLEQGVKGGVWFSLIDKVWSPRNLESAFAKVRANRGSAGVDHQTIAMFAKRREIELRKLNESLKRGDYRPQAIRRVHIPKPGSKETRPLGIPTVRDRAVQTALRNVIEPIFEKEFAKHSYGFRPNRGCKDALRRVDELLRGGYHYVVDADLRKYFDSIPHDKLMEQVQTRIADRRVLQLIELFLKQGVLDGLEVVPVKSGSPQGAVISPLLSNIYLNPLDHIMVEAGYEMVRYADDLVILCRTREEADAAMRKLQEWTESAGLTLHPTKTHVVDYANGEGFDFLGYHFERNRRDPRKTWRWPRKKSIKKLKDAIRTKTPRVSGISLGEIIAKLNPTLDGWFEYFKHTNVKTIFGPIDGWIRRRLRRILCKRNKKHRHNGCGYAHQWWTNAFFAEHGLISLEKAHALEMSVRNIGKTIDRRVPTYVGSNPPVRFGGRGGGNALPTPIGACRASGPPS